LTNAFIALKAVKHSPVGLLYYICEWLLWKQHSKQQRCLKIDIIRQQRCMMTRERLT